MMKQYRAAFIVFGIVASVYSLPQLKNCSKSHNVDRCLMENGNRLIPYVFQGIPSLGIPSFDPYIFPYNYVLSNNELVYILNNCAIFGMPGCRVIDVNWDMHKNVLDTDLLCPNIIPAFNYTMHGELLDRRIEAEGPAAIFVREIGFRLTIDYHLKEQNKQHFIVVDQFNLSMSVPSILSQWTHIRDSLNSTEPEINSWLSREWTNWYPIIQVQIQLAYKSGFEKLFGQGFAHFSVEQLLGE